MGRRWLPVHADALGTSRRDRTAMISQDLAGSRRKNPLYDKVLRSDVLHVESSLRSRHRARRSERTVPRPSHGLHGLDDPTRQTESLHEAGTDRIGSGSENLFDKKTHGNRRSRRLGAADFGRARMTASGARTPTTRRRDRSDSMQERRGGEMQPRLQRLRSASLGMARHAVHDHGWHSQSLDSPARHHADRGVVDMDRDCRMP